MFHRSLAPIRLVISWIGFWLLPTAILFIYFLNLPLWLDRVNDTSFAPLTYALIPAAAALFAIFYRFEIIPYLKTPYFWWCFALIAIAGVNYLRLVWLEYPSSDVSVAMDQVERFILLPCYAFLAFLIPKKNFKILLPLLGLVVPGVIVVEFFTPDLFVSDKNDPNKVRIQGFWGNPNAAAEAILLSVLLAATSARRALLSIITTVAIIALAFTGSRAGMAMGIILVGILLISGRLPRLFILLPLAIALSFSALIVQVENLAEDSGRGRGVEDLVNRISIFSGESEKDFSEQARGDAAYFGAITALEKPILGHGVQYRDLVYGVGPHNLVVELAHEYGILGLIIWLALAYILFKNLSGGVNRFKPSLLLFVWFSMFNHNLLEYQWWYIFLAITMYQSNSNTRNPAAHPFSDYTHTRPSHKKRKRKRRKLSF